jgi:hypothetical protein
MAIGRPPFYPNLGNARGRVIKSNDVVVTQVRGEPDPFALQTASLGWMTGTFSPGSAGVHTSGDGRGFSGDRGYGVNRWAGAMAYEAGSVQNLHAPVNPILDPLSPRVGLGAMTSGQPGLPQGGQDDGGLGALAYLGYGQLNGRTGMGG